MEDSVNQITAFNGSSELLTRFLILIADSKNCSKLASKLDRVAEQLAEL